MVGPTGELQSSFRLVVERGRSATGRDSSIEDVACVGSAGAQPRRADRVRHHHLQRRVRRQRPHGEDSVGRPGDALLDQDRDETQPRGRSSLHFHGGRSSRVQTDRGRGKSMALHVQAHGRGSRHGRIPRRNHPLLRGERGYHRTVHLRPGGGRLRDGRAHPHSHLGPRGEAHAEPDDGNASPHGASHDRYSHLESYLHAHL
mmetsp:Transcript_6892/g.20649  ORF Transcript_6892/g.20649 Transcript_6892/m.20649 type:complete len:202 (+) Transcript_6892:1295-1900(+)